MTEDVQVSDNEQSWTDEHTSVLIDLFKDNISNYKTCDVKNDFWEQISELLNTKGFPHKTSEQCKSRWKILLKHYDDYSSSKNKSFIFAHALEEVLNGIEQLESEEQVPSPNSKFLWCQYGVFFLLY